jgi:CRP/FNR family transcriptional regulator, cyclic AMP receptor protein
MMDSLLRDPNLQKLIRTVSEGDVVFKQGDPGSSMYLVVEGVVRIVFKKFGVEHLVGMVATGEIIGEKGILEPCPYKRNFTAYAKTKCHLIEVDANTLKLILTEVPDFHMRILRMVLDRLDKANRLVNLLQLPDSAERLAEYLIYFHEEHCQTLPEGIEVGMSVAEIQFAANIDRATVEESLKAMVKKGILVKKTSGFFLQDKNKLHEFLPYLREKLAA